MTPRAIFLQRIERRISAGCDFLVLVIVAVSVICAVFALYYARTTPT